MKALQWDGKILQVNEVTVPERKKNESLLKVISAGICSTDLEILRGYHEFHGTLGHEFADGFKFNPVPIVVNEITLIGSRCGPMAKAVALLESDKIKPERLIEKSYPLADAVAAINHANEKGVLKVLINFD